MNKQQTQQTSFNISTLRQKKVRSMILAKGRCHLSLTANQITPLLSVLLKQGVDWLDLFMLDPSHLQAQELEFFSECTH